jgi:inorganic phosphate transporter, PiT family
LELALLVAVIVVALTFSYTNGFHDAANAIATSVSTRALTPRAALVMAALMNLLGAFLGTEVAQTVGADIVDPPRTTGSLVVVLAAVSGAIVWNIITWWYGLPTSSSHALIGGLVGATMASSGVVLWAGVVESVLIPMVVAPAAGFVAAYLLMTLIKVVFRDGHPGTLNRRFRIAQTFSASAMALGHGLQDAQKTMGVITLALVVGGYQTTFEVPWWVILAAALGLASGTYAGGWRIMRTLGRRIVHLDSPRGFAAETTAASVLYVAAFAFHAPISTTHAITAAVTGVGATRRASAVRWGVAGNIVSAWLLTLPMAALVGAVLYWLLSVLPGLSRL